MPGRQFIGRDAEESLKLAGMQVDGMAVDYIASRNDRVNAVTLDDVNRIARELLDPELANLEVWTAGLGFRFLRASSLDLVYHRYAQDELAAYLRDANLRRRPYGRDRDLGDELDVVLGIEEWERFEIKAVFAVFWPGQAFGRGEDRESYLGSLRFRMNF